MGDLSKNGKVELTKSKIKEVFAEQGVPIPNTLKPKPSKLERKLTHIGVEHLFMGVLQQLKRAEAELHEILDATDKKGIPIEGDWRAVELGNAVKSTREFIESTIDNLGTQIETHPNLAELEDIFEKLQAELNAALELHLNLKKGKDDEDESNSSELPE